MRSRTLLAVAAILGLAWAQRAEAAPAQYAGHIAGAAGYRLMPNARFEELARQNGFTVTSRSRGGFAGLLSFGYRPVADADISIEVGAQTDSFGFETGERLEILTAPLLLTGRYYLLPGAVQPYLGLGGGYVLNFFQAAPLGFKENHSAGPFLIAGVSVDLGGPWSMVLEGRVGFSRIDMPELGSAQVGGGSALVGLQYAFAPDPPKYAP